MGYRNATSATERCLPNAVLTAHALHTSHRAAHAWALTALVVSVAGMLYSSGGYMAFLVLDFFDPGSSFLQDIAKVWT